MTMQRQIHWRQALLLGAALFPLTIAQAQVPIRGIPKVQQSPNIILILGDDLGNDMLSSYAEAPNPPCTPNLDQLAADGILFRNAFTNPTCSPTRAQVLTGRHGFRTGIGFPITPTTFALDLAEVTIPEMLPGYQSSAIGKWHLGNNATGLTNPNLTGFDHFAGSLRGAVPDYYNWQKVVDGSPSMSTTYATTDTANEAILAMQSMQEPWFLYVNFNAIHTPAHTPPSNLCSCPASFCAGLGMGSSTADRIKAAAEAMDTELGRVLSTLERVDPEALVIFLGDNGTAGQATEAPYDPSHAKGSVYEQGINVPLIIKGPGVAKYECDALVSSSDLFATFAELAGSSVTADDSVSMVPYFQPGTASLRSTVYAEIFQPNGLGPYTRHDRCLRTAQYKLIRSIGQSDEFYDIIADPLETNDLLPTLMPGDAGWDEYQALVIQLVNMGVG
ncbi:MAG: arylsulfatase B [Candidatus Paceibacteria bacterium]|jgi:arylsulfatase B